MASVHVHEAGGSERVIPLRGQVVTFGRSGENDLVLDGAGVSRHHGRFTKGSDDRWWVEDVGSTNGILMRGTYVTRQMLADGDEVLVGDVTLTFRAGRSVPAAASVCGAATSPTTVHAVTISDQASGVQSMVECTVRGVRDMDSKRLVALCEISRRLMDQSDVAGLIDVASNALIESLQAEVVVFGLTCDPEHETEHLVVRPPGAAADRVILSRSILRRTIDNRSAQLVSDTRTDERLGFAQSIIVGGISSALCVPMMRNDQVTGFIYVDSRRRGRSYDERDLQFGCAVGAMVGTAIENARLREAEIARQRLEAELAGAREVQQSILPSSWPQVPGWEVFGEHATCHEVGGDYYDAIVARDGRIWLIMADVAGKGAPAALVAACFHAALHAVVGECSSPAALLRRLNTVLLPREASASFITCLAALLDPATGDVLLSSAGHPAAAYVEHGREPCVLGMPSHLMLGAFDDAEYADMNWQFPQAEGTLLLYTDGATEAFNHQNEQFGEVRLLSSLAALSSRAPRDVVRGVREAVDRFRGGCRQSDDLTLLACGRRAG